MKRASRSLTVYKRNLPAKRTGSMSIGVIIGIIVIGIIIYIFLKSKTSSTAGQYKNLETWNVSYNPDGLPTKIEIHREATRT